MVAEETAIIETLGDDSCSGCADEKKRLTEKVKGPKFSYEYIDVNSDRGQKGLEERGVKEGEKVDVPITTIQRCVIEKDADGHESKKCGPKMDFKDSYLESIEKGELPEGLD